VIGQPKIKGKTESKQPRTGREKSEGRKHWEGHPKLKFGWGVGGVEGEMFGEGSTPQRQGGLIGGQRGSPIPRVINQVKGLLSKMPETAGPERRQNEQRVVGDTAKGGSLRWSHICRQLEAGSG